jgi:hypothetical protein
MVYGVLVVGQNPYLRERACRSRLADPRRERINFIHSFIHSFIHRRPFFSYQPPAQLSQTLRRLLWQRIDRLTSPDPRSRLIAVIPSSLTHNSRTLSYHDQVRIANMGILGQVLYFAVHPNQLRSIIQWSVSQRKR